MIVSETCIPPCTRHGLACRALLATFAGREEGRKPIEEGISLFARLFRSDSAAEAPAWRPTVPSWPARAPALYRPLACLIRSRRFEMVVLHTVLVIERLRQGGAAGRTGSTGIDSFCRDMDQSLRELGFGDLAVPKRMKKLGEASTGVLRPMAARLTIARGWRQPSRATYFRQP